MFGWIEGGLNWGGRRLQEVVNDIIGDNLEQTGEIIVQEARRLAPVKTGRLREGINYIVLHGEGGDRSELRIEIEAPYGIFQEFGTRNIPPHPFIRPALLKARSIWGFDLNVDFSSVMESGSTWHGLHAVSGKGHRKAMMVGPSRIQSLTSSQRLHVESKLIPSIQRFHRGNVKRAKFRIMK